MRKPYTRRDDDKKKSFKPAKDNFRKSKDSTHRSDDGARFKPADKSDSFRPRSRKPFSDAGSESKTRNRRDSSFGENSGREKRPRLTPEKNFERSSRDGELSFRRSEARPSIRRDSSRPPFDEGKRSFAKKSDKPFTKRNRTEDGDSFSKTEKPYVRKTSRDDSEKRESRGFEKKSDRPYEKRSREGNSDFEDKKRNYRSYKSGDGESFSKDDSPAKHFRPRNEKSFAEKHKTGKRPSFKDRPDRYTPAYKKKSNVVERPDDGSMRLNQYMAHAGICSRREADNLIKSGVVTINGVVATEMGKRVMPGDVVKYNGESIKKEKTVYVLLNKPKDFITTTNDPMERKTVMHLVGRVTAERVYPVGRLDRNTTGVLLLTNDGELAARLTHPKYAVPKLYAVELDKKLTQADLEKIREGFDLEDGPINVDAIEYVEGEDKRHLGVQIHSGKNRIVRRIFEHLGYEVIKLDRTYFAGLNKKGLKRGESRILTSLEIDKLKKLVK